LGEAGQQFWDSVFGVGELWISIKTDTQLVQMLAEQIDRRETLREYVANHPDEWHMTKQLNDIEVLIVKNLSLLGFTPADRTRLGLISTKTKSKLEELMALKAKKQNE
jgi:tagatose-1,6-bisphosphate aldolase